MKFEVSKLLIFATKKVTIPCISTQSSSLAELDSYKMEYSVRSLEFRLKHLHLEDVDVLMIVPLAYFFIRILSFYVLMYI